MISYPGALKEWLPRQLRRETEGLRRFVHREEPHEIRTEFASLDLDCE